MKNADDPISALNCEIVEDDCIVIWAVDDCQRVQPVATAQQGSTESSHGDAKNERHCTFLRPLVANRMSEK